MATAFAVFAEELAESQIDLLNANLATKNELANTEATLKAEIAKSSSAERRNNIAAPGVLVHNLGSVLCRISYNQPIILVD